MVFYLHQGRKVSEASNTGIISKSKLIELFPSHPPELIISFLKHMKLCTECTHSFCGIIKSSVKKDDMLLFIPAILERDRPSIEANFDIGWILSARYEDEAPYFSARFLHCLWLELAYRYTLEEKLPIDSSLSGIQRRCSNWINGIHWHNNDGFEILVEHTDKNVSFLMSHHDGNKDDMIILHHNLRKFILTLKQKYVLNCAQWWILLTCIIHSTSPLLT